MVQLRHSVWSLTFSSPMGKIIGLVVLTTIVTLLSIGVPVLDPSIPPSSNLAILPGAGGGVVRNCSASSPKEWQGCLKQLNEGKIQRIYVSGLLNCSPEDPCEGEVQANRAPLLIQGVPPQQSGFKRSGGGAKPLLAVHSTTDLSIRDLLFDESGGESQCTACAAVVRVSQSRRVTVRGVVIKGAKSDGVLFSEVNQGIILSSQITGSGGNGVLLQHAPGMVAPQFDILGNTVRNNREAGLWLSGYGTPETLGRVEGNELRENGDGIVLSGPASSIRLAGNIIEKSGPSAIVVSASTLGHGIALQVKSTNDGEAITDLLIEKNLIISNKGAAVRRDGAGSSPCRNLQVLANTVQGNCGGSGCGQSDIQLFCPEDAPTSNPVSAPIIRGSEGSGSTIRDESHVLPEGNKTTTSSTTTLPPPAAPPPALTPEPTLQEAAALTMETPPPAPIVINAASRLQNVELAPGSLATALYKTQVTSPCVAPSLPLPLELCGVRVRFTMNAMPGVVQAEYLPILAVDRDQVTFQIPMTVALPYAPFGISHKIVVITPDQKQSSPSFITPRTYGPALYQDADEQGLITHADGQRVTPERPALPGYQVVARATGFGGVFTLDSALNTTGTLALKTNEVGGRQYQIHDPVSVFVGDQRVEASSAFKAPDSVGVDHIVFTIPLNLSAGFHQVRACIRYTGFIPPGIERAFNRDFCSNNRVWIAVGEGKMPVLKSVESTSATPKILEAGKAATAQVEGVDLSGCTPSLSNCGLALRFTSLGAVNNEGAVIRDVGRDRFTFEVPRNTGQSVDATLWFQGKQLNTLINLPVATPKTGVEGQLTGALGVPLPLQAAVKLPNGDSVFGVEVTAEGAFESNAATTVRTALTDERGMVSFAVPPNQTFTLRLRSQIFNGDHIFPKDAEHKAQSGNIVTTLTAYFMTRKCFQIRSDELNRSVRPLPNVVVTEQIKGDPKKILSKGRSSFKGEYCTKRLKPGFARTESEPEIEFVPSLRGFKFDPPTVSATVSGNEAVEQVTIRGLKQTSSAVLSGKKPQKKKAPPPKRRAAPDKRTKSSKK